MYVCMYVCMYVFYQCQIYINNPIYFMQNFFSHYEAIVFSVSAHHSMDEGDTSIKLNRASYNDICIGTTITCCVNVMCVFF